MLFTKLLLAYGCLYNTNWCRPHPLVPGPETTEQPRTRGSDPDPDQTCNNNYDCQPGFLCLRTVPTDK